MWGHQLKGACVRLIYWTRPLHSRLGLARFCEREKKETKDGDSAGSMRSRSLTVLVFRSLVDPSRPSRNTPSFQQCALLPSSPPPPLPPPRAPQQLTSPTPHHRPPPPTPVVMVPPSLTVSAVISCWGAAAFFAGATSAACQNSRASPRTRQPRQIE